MISRVESIKDSLLRGHLWVVGLVCTLYGTVSQFNLVRYPFLLFDESSLQFNVADSGSRPLHRKVR